MRVLCRRTKRFLDGFQIHSLLHQISMVNDDHTTLSLLKL